jgi:hypothetical protein
MGNAVKVAQAHTVRIRRHHLPVGNIEAVGDVSQQPDLVMEQRHHGSADRAVEVDPQDDAEDTQADQSDDEEEAAIVVVGRPRCTWIWLWGHHHRPSGCAAAICRDAGAGTA